MDIIFDGFVLEGPDADAVLDPTSHCFGVKRISLV